MTKSVFSEEYERFRRLLIEARKDAGLTQVGLAERLSRPQSFVSKFERGERRLDVVEFFEVAIALGIDPLLFLSAVHNRSVPTRRESKPIINEPRVEALKARLEELSESQFVTVESVVAQFKHPCQFRRNIDSNLVSDCVLQEFGDTLRIHHCFSNEAFTKDKFEHALVRVLGICGKPAQLARRGNPGHDVTIEKVAFSLKTQAAADTRIDLIHISKFMELGKGEWGDQLKDLEGLRERFFNHMQRYERILTLRRIPRPGFQFYELVEIPKALLLEAQRGEFEMTFASTQHPKPGTCTVKGAGGKIKFQLYFDGGAERKLQIRSIDKNLCTVHGTWEWEEGTKLTKATVL